MTPATRALAAAAQRLDRERFLGSQGDRYAGSAVAQDGRSQTRHLRQHVISDGVSVSHL